MLFRFKNHLYKILLFLFFILIGCQIQEPLRNHGVLFLENRSAKLTLGNSNENDVISILGRPHSKSINNDRIWIYLERTLSKGKYHKLGQLVLKSNNVLALSFDKYGVLNSKKFYTKKDIKKLSFNENVTENELSKKSFVESFLSSVKEKMYGQRKKKD